MRRVGDRCDAVGQGSRDHALHPAAGSREPPRCCHIDQPGGKPADRWGGGGLDTRPLTLAHHTPSPVSGSVELGVNGGDLHAGPLGRRHQVVLVHAVLQAVRDAAFEGGGHRSEGEGLLGPSPAGLMLWGQRQGPVSQRRGRELLTGDGAAHLPGGLLAGLHRGLLAVPGRVRGTDQVGGVLQGTC